MLKVNPSATVAVSVTLTKKYFFTLEQHEQLGNTGKKNKFCLFMFIGPQLTVCLVSIFLHLLMWFNIFIRPHVCNCPRQGTF